MWREEDDDGNDDDNGNENDDSDDTEGESFSLCLLLSQKVCLAPRRELPIRVAESPISQRSWQIWAEGSTNAKRGEENEKDIGAMIRKGWTDRGEND